jgi:hypothetical protein
MAATSADGGLQELPAKTRLVFLRYTECVSSWQRLGQQLLLSLL